jgi:hypothetical protein
VPTQIIREIETHELCADPGLAGDRRFVVSFAFSVGPGRTSGAGTVVSRPFVDPYCSTASDAAVQRGFCLFPPCIIRESVAPQWEAGC